MSQKIFLVSRIREVWIKTTLGFYLISAKMTKITKTNAGREFWSQRPSFPMGGIAEWWSHHGNHCEECAKMLQLNLPYDSVFISSVWVFCLHVCMCTICAWHLRRSEDGTGPLALELQMVVNHQANAGTKPRSSARATSALNHGSISPASRAEHFGL